MHENNIIPQEEQTNTVEHTVGVSDVKKPAKVETKKSNNNASKIIIAIVAIVVIGSVIVGGTIFTGIAGIIGGIFFGSDSSFNNSTVTDEMYIGVAKQIISKSLKKPSSLEVNDAYVYEKDDYGSAIVYMDITSENSYGGSDRDTVYICVMHLKSDGNYQFHPTMNYVEEKLNLDILKKINGYGQPE